MPNQHTVGDPVAHFWSNVDKSGGPDACWPWMASRFPRGYGSARWAGRSRRANRVAWMIANGEIPDDMDVLHACDYPPCCNPGPGHLWLGTHAENMADMVAKGRHVASRGDRNGNYTHPERRPRGEQHSQAKLTADQVLEIRRRVANRETQRALAAAFGVSHATVGRIARHETWADEAALRAGHALLEGAGDEQTLRCEVPDV